MLGKLQNDLRKVVADGRVPRPDVVYVVDEVGYRGGNPNAQARWVESWLPDLANAAQLGKDGIVVLNDGCDFLDWKKAVENVLLPDSVAPSLLNAVRLALRRPRLFAYDVAAFYVLPDQPLVLHVWTRKWVPDRCSFRQESHRTFELVEEYADYPLGLEGNAGAATRVPFPTQARQTNIDFDDSGFTMTFDEMPSPMLGVDRDRLTHPRLAPSHPPKMTATPELAFHLEAAVDPGGELALVETRRTGDGERALRVWNTVDEQFVCDHEPAYDEQRQWVEGCLTADDAPCVHCAQLALIGVDGDRARGVSVPAECAEPAQEAECAEPAQEAQRAKPDASGAEHGESRNECVICMDAEPEYAVVPCGHLVVCAGCAAVVGAKCPLCRGAVTGTMRIYVS